MSLARRALPPAVWVMDRIADIDSNATSFTSWASSFAASTAETVALVCLKQGQHLQGFLIAPDDADSENAANHLAKTVGATARRVDAGSVVLSTAHMRQLVFDSRRSAVRSSQVGADPAELSKILAHAMTDGSWVGVTLRPPRNRETSRHGEWLKAQVGSQATPTHHSTDSSARVVSFTAGGSSSSDVKRILGQLASALPGFDVPTRTAGLGSGRVRAGLFAGLSLVGYVAGMFTFGVSAVTAAATTVPALGAVWAWLSRRSLTRDGGLGVVLDDPAVAPWLARKPRSRTNEETGEVTVESPRYPLPVSSFLIGPQLAVGVVAPQAGASTGATSTSERPTPAPLTDRRVGPLLGVGSDGMPACISARDLWSGVFVSGIAGSGKSVLVHNIFAWAAHDRARSGRGALVSFETKPEGLVEYRDWAAHAGLDPVVVDLNNPSTFSIDLFPETGDLFERCAVFVDTMVYTFGEDAVGYRSQGTLRDVLPVAHLVTAEDAERAGAPVGVSPIMYAYILLAGHGDELGAKLAQALFDREALGGDGLLSQACLGLRKLYGSVSPSQRGGLVDAPRTKLQVLAQLEKWFDPARRRVSWRELVTGQHTVVINTGSPVGGGAIVSDQATETVSSMLAYTLRRTIEQYCAGWQAQDRFVTLFADELTALAGSSPDVVSWLREKGRSYGVRLVFATQFPEQLHPKVLQSVLGYRTKVMMQQENSRVAEQLAHSLTGDGGAWSHADILTLPPYVAIVSTAIDGHHQPAFTVRSKMFDASKDSYLSFAGDGPGVGRV